MTSIYGGCGAGENTSLHMLHFFDGSRIREIELMTFSGNVYWTERTIPGILEIGMKYRTVKSRLAAYEKRCTQRIG